MFKSLFGRLFQRIPSRPTEGGRPIRAKPPRFRPTVGELTLAKN
jgi:hypothetical protein